MQQARLLLVHLVVDGSDLRAQLFDLRVVRAQFHALLRQLGLQSGALFPQLREQCRIGPVVRGLQALDATRIRVAGEDAVACFGDHACDARVIGGLGEILQIGTDLVVRGIQRVHAERLRKLHQLLLRGLHLLLQVAERAGEPFRDALRGSVTRLVAARDVVIDDGIDDVCGELAVQGAVADPDQVRVRNQHDLQVLVQGADDAFPHGAIVVFEIAVLHGALRIQEDRIVCQVELAGHALCQGIALQNDGLRLQARGRIGAAAQGGAIDTVLRRGAGPDLDLTGCGEEPRLRPGAEHADDEAEQQRQDENPAALPQDDGRLGEGRICDLHLKAGIGISRAHGLAGSRRKWRGLEIHQDSIKVNDCLCPAYGTTGEQSGTHAIVRDATDSFYLTYIFQTRILSA